MKVQAKVRLNLNKQINKLVVTYNTYVKSTFDEYVIASIIVNSNTEKEALNYIDDITGKGSLNKHFRNLYTKYKKDYSFDDLENVLKNSLIPRVNKDEHIYIYFPDMNISFYRNNKFDGNLSNDKDFPKYLVTKGEYIGSSVIEGKINIESDIYNVILNDEKVELLINNKKISMNKDLFESSVVHEVKKITKYKGIVHEKISGNGWFPVTNAKLNDVTNAINYFIDEGDHYLLTNLMIKKTEICKIWGIYLYRETSLEFNQDNSKYCKIALNTLKESNKINEIKTKTLVQLLKSVSPELIQDYINYILNKKNSKELALLGLSIVNKGYEKGWNEETVKNFKEFSSSPKEILLTYKVDSELNYTINELLDIYNLNKQVLKSNHLDIIKKHFKDKESKMQFIKNVSSEILQSSRRDDVKKKIAGDKEATEYNNLCNKYIAHVKKDIKLLNDNELKTRYEVFERIAELDKKMIKKLEGRD